jgi:hypothetical protein
VLGSEPGISGEDLLRQVVGERRIEDDVARAPRDPRRPPGPVRRALRAARPRQPDWSRTWRYASAVIAKPFGTRTPRRVSCRYISPNDAFLPPTNGTSAKPSSSNRRTKRGFASIEPGSSCPRAHGVAVASIIESGGKLRCTPRHRFVARLYAFYCCRRDPTQAFRSSTHTHAPDRMVDGSQRNARSAVSPAECERPQEPPIEPAADPQHALKAASYTYVDICQGRHFAPG